MKEYVEKNKEAYDKTAKEFEKKIQERAPADEECTAWIQPHLTGTKILELGPGSGYIARLLTDAGYDVTGIELSEEMAKIATKTAPYAEIMIGDFLTHDFKEERYDAIIGVAFIHLFTEEDADKALQKMRLLCPEGTIALTTTLHEELQEGYKEKTNFQTPVKRYRRAYTKGAFLDLIEKNGLKIKAMREDDDLNVPKKRWIAIIAD